MNRVEPTVSKGGGSPIGNTARVVRRESVKNPQGIVNLFLRHYVEATKDQYGFLNYFCGRHTKVTVLFF